MEPRIGQRTHIAPTAHLAQTMTLLSLTADELRQQVESELASNPALELCEERRCPMCGRVLTSHSPCPACTAPKITEPEAPIVFISPREDFYTSHRESREDMSEEDDYTTASEDLPTYVLRQIAPELEPTDRKLAAFILTHLDEDGFLTTTTMEICRYQHVPPSQVQKIIRLIQRADPVGVGSASPQEALLVQLEVLAETRPVPPLAQAIICDGMDLLSRRQFSDLAHLLHTSLHQVQDVARFISENLNPFPARSHWGDVRETAETGTNVYHQPDIIISYLNERPENPLVVEIIMPISGTLRINPLFRQAIHEANAEKLEDWKADLDRASLFVKCIQQRNHTMLRLMERLVNIQGEFIRYGETYLKSITRAQLSGELEVHESTISRAVSSKAVELPSGRIIPMSMFFDRSLNARTVLRQIIDNESRPLSDTELAGLLSQEGYPVARRTVAKYRTMEGILPAHLRRSQAIRTI
jgi:RNA polymerase sigma-54 factor